MVRDFDGIGIKRLNVIGLFEADQNLQGGEGKRLCRVNDWTAGAVPAGRGVHAAPMRKTRMQVRRTGPPKLPSGRLIIGIVLQLSSALLQSANTNGKYGNGDARTVVRGSGRDTGQHREKGG
jgi:hypothetical protein